MHEAQNMKLKLSVGSPEKNTAKKQLTYKQLVKWIENTVSDPYIREELLKLAKNHPSNYELFRKNCPEYVARIQQQKKDKSN
jgi:hypothetical protein